MSKYRQVPVFFDPDQKRWPRLRRGVFLTGLFLSLLFGVLIVSILINPLLPSLKLPKMSFLPNDARAPVWDKIETDGQRKLRETKQRLEVERNKRQQARHPRPHHDQIVDQIEVGFYVSWDETSMSSLKENIKNLDVLVCEFLHLENAGGDLSLESDKHPEGAGEKAVTEFVRSTRPDLKIFALVNNFDGKAWESDKLAAMLANREARARCISGLADYVRDYDLAGISLDFENVLDSSQAALIQFTNELSAALHPAGREVSINLPVNNDSFDYRKLSAAADYVILMAYDQHYVGSDPGPVAGLDWFEENLRLRQTDVPASKTIVAIGNYAYDWKEGGEPEIKTFEEAILTAAESSDPNEKIQIRLDPMSLNPSFEWEEVEDGKEKRHQVWMLDAVSAFNQIAVTRALGASGVALWRLGSEDPSLWSFFGADVPLDETAASKLTQMKYGYGLDYEGKGEILRIAARPGDGVRQIKFDPAKGMIVAETVTDFASPWIIYRYGDAPRKIALTFDDGPDPDYTPKILDILKQKNAHATFFVVGLNAELHPDLLQREINEGHLVGNHTFTHPNLATISETQFRLELKATQVLFESILGRRTLLFRPPFAEDSEPVTPDEVRPLELVNDLGYVTVGMQIDPKDWKSDKADEIVAETVAMAEHGVGPRSELEQRSYNIVLLHDSGGDRSQTVEALPRLIDELRARGFELVTVGDLLGKTRDDVMPPVPADLWWQTWSGRAAFATVNALISAVQYLFLIGIVLGAGRLVFIGSLAVIEHWRERHAQYDSAFSPTVAVIVPAFNEEKVIIQTVTSLLASDHPPNFEIVVVDDGSTDGTYQKCVEAFAGEPRVRIFTKPNSGKPDALNHGARHTSSDIVIALDADTLFARDTMSKLIRHFVDPKVGAVAGNAKVGNRINLLTRWQALEYITSQNLDRRAFNLLNCVTVVPGAVGAWRRELIERVGGFNDLTLAEDADLTMAIRKLGYSISYEDEAVGLTEAPDTLRGFVRQRYRWMYGTLQAAWKHVDALFRPRYGSLGFVALPNIFIFQVFFPLISPVMDLLLLLTLTISGIKKLQHPQEFSSDSLRRTLFYYALFVAIEFVAATVAFLLEKKENKRLLVWLFWQRFFYRQLMYYVAIKATLASLKGIAVGWNKVDRKATVKAS